MTKPSEKKAPRMVYYVGETFMVDGHGYRPSIVVEGESGHHPTGDDDWETNPRARRPYFWGPTFADACETARVMNDRLGVSPEDAFAIVTHSMSSAVKNRTTGQTRRENNRARRS